MFILTKWSNDEDDNFEETICGVTESQTTVEVWKAAGGNFYQVEPEILEGSGYSRT